MLSDMGRDTSGLTPAQKELFSLIFVDPEMATLTTTNNDWTQISSYDVELDQQVTLNCVLTAKRTDDYGGYSSGHVALVINNGGVAELVQNVTTDYRKTTQVGLNFRIVEVGAGFSLEVRGRVGETWDWEIMYWGVKR